MNEREYAVVVAMAHYGGSFVKALATAYMRADRRDFIRLQTAFPELWQKYEQPHFSGLHATEEAAR